MGDVITSKADCVTALIDHSHTYTHTHTHKTTWVRSLNGSSTHAPVSTLDVHLPINHVIICYNYTDEILKK